MVDKIGHPLSPQLLQVFLMTLPIFLRLLCSAKPFYVCASRRPKSNCDLVLASIAYILQVANKRDELLSDYRLCAAVGIVDLMNSLWTALAP